MAGQIVFEFDGCLRSLQNESLEHGMIMTFNKVKFNPTATEADKMEMCRFRVVMTEIKDW